MQQNLSAQGLGPQSAPPMKRLGLALMGGAGLILLGGGGALLGLNSKLTTLQTSAAKKDTEVSSSEGIARRYQTTLSGYNETEGRIKYLESSVSAKSYVPTLLKQVQMLAAQTRLDVTSVRPALAPPPAPPARHADSDGGTAVGAAKTPPPPPYDTLDVEVDVTGTYADTSVFLYSLTRFPKIVAVDGVQMHPNAPAVPGGTASVTTNLRLTAFMFHNDGTAAPGGAAATDSVAQATPIAVPAALPVAAPPFRMPAPAPAPASVVPPPAAGTISGAAERAAVGAAATGRAATLRSSSALTTL